MAACFEEWTVLPHKPVVKHSDRLWTVQGTMPDGKTQRVMTVAKMDDDRLVIHNAIALDDQEMLELEAWGTPAALLVPNGFHRQDVKIWHLRFREAKIYCPERSRGRVEQVVKVDGSYADAPSDEHVQIAHLPGLKDREGTLTVVDEQGRTVVFNDSLCNMKKLGGLPGFFMAPTGELSIPRAMKWFFVSDKQAYAEHLQELSRQEDLVRLVPGHGRLVEERAGVLLKKAVAGLG